MLLQIYIPIWFYSNLISQLLHILCPYLHSNMVLFKLFQRHWYGSDLCIYIPIWFYSNYTTNVIKVYVEEFTFQYGSIQIGNANSPSPFLAYLHSNMVLFKLMADYYPDALRINLHSNMVLFKLKVILDDLIYPLFTFQYGSIQIIRKTLR